MKPFILTTISTDATIPIARGVSLQSRRDRRARVDVNSFQASSLNARHWKKLTTTARCACGHNWRRPRASARWLAPRFAGLAAGAALGVAARMNFLKKGLAQVSAAVEKAREATTMGGTSGEGAMAGSRSSGALPYAPGAPAGAGAHATRAARVLPTSRRSRRYASTRATRTKRTSRSCGRCWRARPKTRSRTTTRSRRSWTGSPRRTARGPPRPASPTTSPTTWRCRTTRPSGTATPRAGL